MQETPVWMKITETRKGNFMKVAWCIAVMISLIGCQGTGQNPVTLENQKDKVSYSIGLNIGASISKDSIDINPAALLQGIKDARLDSSKRLMSKKEVQECMTAFQQQMMEKQTAMAKAASEKNVKEGEAFLEKNKKEEGVVTLPSGLQYKVLTAGNGPIPKKDQTVTTNYTGTLIDGTEFDSSVKRGQPATFAVSGVIPGWTEELQLMKVGSKWKLFIPANLAYGDRGAGTLIPPGSTLIFEIELLAIK